MTGAECATAAARASLAADTIALPAAESAAAIGAFIQRVAWDEENSHAMLLAVAADKRLRRALRDARGW